jgi:hypothetical protein
VWACTYDLKVIVFKKKRRHNSKRESGYRQWTPVLRVDGTTGDQASQRREKWQLKKPVVVHVMEEIPLEGGLALKGTADKRSWLGPS